MIFTEPQIESLSPNPAAFTAGKKLSSKSNWLKLAKNDRAVWGEIKGSGSSPYKTQIDINSIVYKCSCPSRQFPCKHTIALMLLCASSEKEFNSSVDEPEWVTNWIEKRQNKAIEPGKKVGRTEEDQAKLDKAREKTQADRFDSVTAGVAELELWLKDMIRIGILELPNKPASDFEKVAARMVDAKAPGLAGWVKSLTKLDFVKPDEWQTEALKILSKLYLIIKTFQNYNNLTPIWQTTIKNLVGWNQSTKELLADKEAECVKDKWLLAGQEMETMDDIDVQRNWLVGCSSNRRALILNFVTKFSVIENPLLPGSVIEAELSFFPSVTPNRAVIKMQRSVSDVLDQNPQSFNLWNDVLEYRAEQLRLNPWANDHLVLLKDARLYKSDSLWIVYDAEKNYMPVVVGFNLEKMITWLAITGNGASTVGLVLRNDKVLPLGLFQHNKYILL